MVEKMEKVEMVGERSPCDGKISKHHTMKGLRACTQMLVSENETSTAAMKLSQHERYQSQILDLPDSLNGMQTCNLHPDFV